MMAVSGIASKRLQQIFTSPTLALTNRVLELKQAGHDVITLGVGEPDFETPAHIRQAAIEAIHKGYTRYTQSTGIPELKKAVIEKFARDYSMSINPSNIIITAGGKFALAAAIMAFCDVDDEVIILAPNYVSYPDMVKLAGAKPVFVKTDVVNGFDINLADLDRVVTPKTKMLIFNNPNNPTGVVYQEQVTKKLAGWLKSTNIIALTDDIYDAIVFDGLSVRPLMSYPEIRDQVIMVNGVSKAYAMTGWRIGYAVAHEEYISQLAKVQSHFITHPASIAQWAAAAALSGDQMCVIEMKKAFWERRDYVYERLGELDRIQCIKSQGAFYFFPEVSGYFGTVAGKNRINNAIELCHYLLENQHVALVPGEAFAAPNHIRISFAASLKNLNEAMDRIKIGLQNLN